MIRQKVENMVRMGAYIYKYSQNSYFIPIFSMLQSHFICSYSGHPRGIQCARRVSCLRAVSGYDVLRLSDFAGSGVSPAGSTGISEYLLAHDITLLDRDADLSLLAVPLLPLPANIQLLPYIALEWHSVSDSRLLPLEPCSLVVSPPRDLFQYRLL